MTKSSLYDLSKKTCVEMAHKRGMRFYVEEPLIEGHEYFNGKTKFFVDLDAVKNYYKNIVKNCKSVEVNVGEPEAFNIRKVAVACTICEE